VSLNESFAGLRAARIAVLVMLAPAFASADDKGRQACFASSEQAQLRRNEGKLRAARRELMVCAGEPCPAQMRRDCAKWLDEVESTLATVVFQARDARGNELTDVRVSADGEQLVDRLDGKPVEVDPGERTFAFETKGRSLERRFVVRAGDRAAKLDVVFDEAPMRPSTPEPHAPPLAPVEGSHARSIVPFVVGGLAVASGAIGTTVAVIGYDHEKSLRRTCAPRCSERDVDILHHQYLAADILFGVAIVSAGVATWLFLANDRAEKPPAPGTLHVAPAVGLGALGLTGVF
jgi:hypothetical protein